MPVFFYNFSQIATTNLEFFILYWQHCLLLCFLCCFNCFCSLNRINGLQGTFLDPTSIPVLTILEAYLYAPTILMLTFYVLLYFLGWRNHFALFVLSLFTGWLELRLLHVWVICNITHSVYYDHYRFEFI